MFWSGEKIQYFSSLGEGLISPFFANQIDCNAYILRVGAEYYVTSDNKKTSDGQNKVKVFREFTLGRESAVIPSGQFGFLITHESVKMPPNVMGFISLKTKAAKFKGLVNISGFHVDPGYEGKLIFSVFNAGPNPISIRHLDELFMIWFADIDASSFRTPNSRSVKRELPINHISTQIVNEVSDKLTSLQDMSKKIESLETKLTVIYSVGAILATSAIIFLALYNTLNGN